MWEGLCSQKSGIDKISAFDAGKYSCELAGEVGEFKIRNYMPKSLRKNTKLMCRDIELSIIAAGQAIESSGLITKGIDPEKVNVDPGRMGINIGAGLISCDLVELAPAIKQSIVDGKFDMCKWGGEGINSVTPLWLLKYLPNMLACHIGIIHDIQGPSNTITCGEISGMLSVIEAASVIDRGCCDIAVAGGVEAKVNPIVMMRQCLLERSATGYNERPSEACRPFDSGASGSVFGEGAALFVLEEAEKAVARGADIYAEIAGWGESSSINTDMSHLEASGEGVKIAIEKALEDANISGGDIDLIVACGTGIAADDAAEAKGMRGALGADIASKVPVFATKSMVSHTGAASAAVDIAAAALAIKNQRIPGCKNLNEKAADCELNLVTETMDKKIEYAVVCGYTFGGQTAAVVLKKHK
jgi:3-oxoacyl-[acyl-carrier-protein] synthase II